MTLNPAVAAVTDRIRRRSAAARGAYLERLDSARQRGPVRGALGCTNLAHAWAGAPVCEQWDDPQAFATWLIDVVGEKTIRT